jgi:UDP-glucose 4-epimerase
MKIMNYLVTGGAGFIGSHLVGELLKLGHHVTVIDDFSSGKIENLAFSDYGKNLKIVTRSITSNLGDIFKREEFDAVFHLAALVSVPYSIEHPIETNDVNAGGSLNLLNNCREFGVKRFIFSSSCSVYGNPEKLPALETFTPDPLSPYATQKLITENYCRLFSQIYGLECVCLRYFNVFGPRQNPNGNYACLIPRFITLIKSEKTPKINGDGTQTRDFIFVSDVVDANLAAATTRNKACFGQVFNIGSGINKSVNQITESIIKLFGRSIEPIHGPAVIEPKNALADVSKAREFIGWEPQVSFEEGLQQTYNYFVSI